MLEKGHIILYKIEDVLQIPNLCDRYRHRAVKLIEKIQWCECRGYTNDYYYNALKEARDLMLELESKSDNIHYTL